MTEQLEGRVWELDFLRGICIFLVLLEHFLYCWLFLQSSVYIRDGMVVNALNSVAYALERISFKPIIVSITLIILFLISGISTTFVKKPWKRILLLWGVAYGVTLLSLFCYFVLHWNVLIYFGALHLYALCATVFFLVQKGGLPTLIMVTCAIWIFAIALQVFHFKFAWTGWCLIGLPTQTQLFSTEFFYTLDYLPWFMLGGILGQTLYKNKKSLLPKLDCKATMPVRLLGKKSGLVYVGHFIAMPVIVCILIFLMGLI